MSPPSSPFFFLYVFNLENFHLFNPQVLTKSLYLQVTQTFTLAEKVAVLVTLLLSRNMVERRQLNFFTTISLIPTSI